MPYEPIDVNNSELSFGGFSLNHSNTPLKPGIIRPVYVNLGIFSLYDKASEWWNPQLLTSGCRIIIKNSLFQMLLPDGDCGEGTSFIEDPYNP